ncbi:hypothetical protein HDU85_001436 [Gaertneriomyces sp. JEL0708]|nr:hypothetical protein HDU85_001436 [Gaertneriomyces sp. JEL0708]
MFHKKHPTETQKPTLEKVETGVDYRHGPFTGTPIPSLPSPPLPKEQQHDAKRDHKPASATKHTGSIRKSVIHGAFFGSTEDIAKLDRKDRSLPPSSSAELLEKRLQSLAHASPGTNEPSAHSERHKFDSLASSRSGSKSRLHSRTGSILSIHDAGDHEGKHGPPLQIDEEILERPGGEVGGLVLRDGVLCELSKEDIEEQTGFSK